MFKKIFKSIKETIKEEYKFIIFLLLLTIIFNIPVNYYITVGGGISDISDRIKVENGNDSKGSFNLSYVTQLDGTLLSYGLSYVIPSWERESADNYKIELDDDIKDIEFRNKIELKDANSTATYWAYKLANKKVEEVDKKIYVISKSNEEYHTPIEVQDEIIGIDNLKSKEVDEYVAYLQTKSAGDEVNVRVIRNKKEKIVKAKIYEEDGRKLMGVYLHSIVEYKTDPKVEIKYKRKESGPSAGMMSTLEMYNQLIKEDLTHGLKIAGTGTINYDGSVGEIGGIEHKIKGATHAKADIFLSPGGKNYEDAQKYIKDNKLKIKLIKIDNINDAIDKLKLIK